MPHCCVLCNCACCNNREQERLDWAVEVLVTRSELDEKKNRMAELEQQVRRGRRITLTVYTLIGNSAVLPDPHADPVVTTAALTMFARLPCRLPS